MCLKNFLSSFSRTQVHYPRIYNSNVTQLCNALALFAVGRRRACYGTSAITKCGPRIVLHSSTFSSDVFLTLV